MLNYFAVLSRVSEARAGGGGEAAVAAVAAAAAPLVRPGPGEPARVEQQVSDCGVIQL